MYALGPVDGISPLGRYLREADFVIVAVPHTPATRRLLSAAELAMMKPTAWLINVSRGPVVDEAALAAAFDEFDGAVFGGRLRARVTACSWNKRLTTTAGRCVFRRATRSARTNLSTARSATALKEHLARNHTGPAHSV